MERPTNPMMITGVLMFDEPITLARLKKVIEKRFLDYSRFRMKPVETPGGMAWQTDDDFDLDWHVRLSALPRSAPTRRRWSASSARSPPAPARQDQAALAIPSGREISRWFGAGFAHPPQLCRRHRPGAGAAVAHRHCPQSRQGRRSGPGLAEAGQREGRPPRRRGRALHQARRKNARKGHGHVSRPDTGRRAGEGAAISPANWCTRWRCPTIRRRCCAASSA